MITVAESLLEPARDAGMAVPDIENLEFVDPERYPHWVVFCTLQIGRELPHPLAHHDNAKLIAAIPMADILTLTVDDLSNMGFN